MRDFSSRSGDSKNIVRKKSTKYNKLFVLLFYLLFFLMFNLFAVVRIKLEY